jgi:protoporphyrinogen IX oxidase
VNGYLWLKTLHVLAIISWMVGMLYLPRLFVYHAEAGPGSAAATTFVTMERRLMRAIMLPAMLVVWATGLWLAVQGHWLKAGWLHGKLALVLLLTALHGYLSVQRKRLAAGTCRRSSRDFRIINEIPTVLLVGIVILVIIKPF